MTTTNKQLIRPPRRGWMAKGFTKGVRFLFVAVLTLLGMAQAQAARWDDGYRATWVAEQGAFEIRLRIYDDKGRDDVLQNGVVKLDGETIIDGISNNHHSFPYWMPMNFKDGGGKYRYQVKLSNSTWKEVYGSQSRVEYSERDGDDSRYSYIVVRVYVRNFNTIGGTHTFNIQGKIDRDATLLENTYPNFDFSTSVSTDYTKNITTLTDDWQNNQSLHLKWATNDNPNTKVSALKVTVGGTSKTYSGNSIPNPVVLTNDWKSLNFQEASYGVTVEATVQPASSSYYGFTISKSLNTATFGQADYLNSRFDPEDANGNPNRITLTWGMSEAASTSPRTDQFSIRRYKHNGSSYVYDNKEYKVDYKKGETEYTYTDNQLDANGVINYRYDLSRNSVLTGYPIVSSSIEVSTQHCSPDSIWATTSERGNSVIVEWADNDIIWSQRTQCKLVQVDLEAMTEYEYDLTEDAYKAKRFVDERVKNCGSYEYRLELTPGGDDYNIPPVVTTAEPVAPYVPGTIEDLSVSKGYFTDRTEVSWVSHNAFDNFVIERKPYGAADSEYAQVGSVTYQNTLTEYSFDDTKGAIGTIYEYRVYGITKCVDVMVYSTDTLVSVGFRSGTGVISGRVTYENGQAVSGVEILPQSDDQDSGKAARLDGSGQIVTEDALVLPATGFSLEAYLRPEGDNAGRTLLAVGSTSLLAFDTEGRLTFRTGQQTLTDPVEHEADDYYHASAVFDGRMMKLYIDSLLVDTLEVGALTVDEAPFIVGAVASGNGYAGQYTGYVDEVRVWDKALTADEIKRDYTRQLYGGETGLMLYYRFNEGVAGEVYDMSFEGEAYHEMHATATGMTYTADATELPSLEQLAIKGITDVNGNYTINGVPYASNGTQYRIIPRYGTHQFDPTERLITMNENNRDFTADFTDNSSFLLSGRVLYSESTIPVEGVMFEVDGVTAMIDNKVVMTNSLGEFEISVPVGQHSVRAVLTNHTFRNDGLLLDSNGENRFYNAPLEGVVFRDETRVRFIGRVAGGPVQQAFPVGHSLSTNNLGDNPTVRLELSGSSANMFSIYEDESGEVGASTEKTVHVTHFRPTRWNWESPDRLPDSTAVTYAERYIEIHPSTNTGEFFVDLIPTAYNVTSATAAGHSDILADLMTLNLTDSLIAKSSAYEYVLPDSLRQVGQDTTAIDSIPYHASAQYIKRVNPTLEVAQLSNAGQPLDYWGDETAVRNAIDGTLDTMQVYFPDREGNERYLFGLPIMSQENPYELQANVFERYSYYTLDEGTPVEVPEREDRVPVTDGIVNFANDLKGTTDTVSVGEDGSAYYLFDCGEPSLSAPNGAKKLEITVQVGDRTIDDKVSLDIIVLGSVDKNTNFVTAGPDLITTVLRDPPGSGSYSYLEAGTSYEYTSTYVGSMEVGTESGAIAKGNASIKTLIGALGSGTITEIKAGTESSLTGIFELNVEGHIGTGSRLTFTNRWQTSEDPTYVGADADIYIGKSTNIIMGTGDAVEILRDGEFNTENVKVLANSNGYSLVQRETILMGAQFSTAFAYPQIHIENVLIPQLKEVMMQQFTFGLDSAAAQQQANQTQKIVYTTDITNMEDTCFGKQGYYKRFIPHNPGDEYPGQIYASNPDHANLDTILTIRQSIDNWELAIADNERKKITASKEGENISFHAGSSIERSMEYAGSDVNVVTFSFTIGSHQTSLAGALVNDAGVQATLSFIETTSHGREYETTQEATRTFGFVLAEDGTDYISVDVRKVNNDQKLTEIVNDAGGDLGHGVNWGDLLDNDNLKGVQNEYVFITRGGATSCPWEGGSVSKYYQPGTTIDQPTAQMEKPVLTVDESTVSNVPASRRAVFTLHLGNESETGDDQYFMLSQVDETNPDGAKFYIDGTPLGDGRTFFVPAGGELVKTLEVEKGTAMVYHDLQLVLHSTCQYDLTGFQDLIGATVSLNAEFTPSCTDLTLASPLDQWVLNSESPNVTEDGKYFIPVTVTDFDVNYENFHHIDIQFKGSYESDDRWVTKARFYRSEDDMNADTEATCEKFLIEGADIQYNIVLDEATDVDQSYDICAVSACRDENGFIETVSNISTGTKDTYRPRLFGQPQPADGILGVEDEVRLNFNENIAAGYITQDNVSATGVRVGTANTNNASVSFDGVSEYAATELPKNFAGKSFTVETNILFDDYRDEAVFALGDINTYFEMGFDADGYLTVQVGGSEVRASAPLDKQLQGQWQHVAVVYEAGDHPTLTGYVDLVQVLPPTPVEAFDGMGSYVFGRGMDGTRPFHGRLNEFRIWTEPLSLALLNKNRGVTLSGMEAGLQHYYPMTEGKGDLLEDKAGSNHAALHASWYVSDPGYAAYFLGDGYLDYATSEIVVTDEMDYTVELWFKCDPGTNDRAALLSNGQADANDSNGGQRHIYIGFEGGKLLTRNHGYSHVVDEDFRDGAWHHYALTVSRSMDRASVYVDGALKGWFSAANFDGISADHLTLGACRWMQDDGLSGEGIPSTGDYFTGRMDEVRLWNVALNETLVGKRNNTRLAGNEAGLLLYLPFEEVIRDADYNINNLEFHPDNLALDGNGNAQPNAAPDNTGVLQSEDAPAIKDVVMETNIEMEAVVNDDAIILTPRQGINAWNDFEQQIVTFTVTGVQDMNGNRMGSPVTWTAFIDRNHVRWAEAERHVECSLYEGADFTVDIVNVGGMNQGYTVQNLPSWLDVSEPSGTLAPASTHTLQFRVSEALNVGTYDQVLYLVNDNNVARPLNLTVKVNGDTPDWSVDPADYRYNMNVYGMLRVDNIFSTDGEDMLAAFRDGRCVGVAHNTYVDEYDMWYVLLTVYGNEPSHGGLEFRIWDASTGTTYLGEPSRTIAFRNDAIEGSPANPVVFDSKEMQIQNVALRAGWNWVSFHVQNDPNTFARTFGGSTWADGDLVKDEAHGKFASYAAQGGTWMGALADTLVSVKHMYLVKAGAAHTLSLGGTPLRTLDERTVPLRPRWNYIAYLPATNLTVAEAMAGYEASEGDIVKDQTAFSMYSAAIGWLGSLDYMRPGTGYMLYRAAADSSQLIYPLLSANTARTRSAQAPQAAGEAAAYPSNMSVVAEIADGLVLEPGDRLLALSADGECRGVAQAVAHPAQGNTLHFITIGGDATTAVTFALERGGDIIAQAAERVDFEPDATWGSPSAPYALHFTGGGAALVYPTLFRDEVHVRLAGGQGAATDIRLLDLSGRVIRACPALQPGADGLHLTLDALDDLAPGMYLLDIRTDGQSHIHKLEKR